MRGFEFVLSCFYEAGQGGKPNFEKLMKNIVLKCDIFALVWNVLWAFLDQYEKVCVETIILVLRSCKSVEARWSYGHLCEDFWFSSKKYQNFVTGLTKRFCNLFMLLVCWGVWWIGWVKRVLECISCIWFWRSNFVIFADSAKKQAESVQITLRPMGLFFLDPLFLQHDA